MQTELTLDKQDFKLDVLNSEFDLIMTISGSIDVGIDGIDYCIITKIEDSNNVEMDNLVRLEWVMSALESHTEVKVMIEQNKQENDQYDESVSYISDRM